MITLVADVQKQHILYQNNLLIFQMMNDMNVVLCVSMRGRRPSSSAVGR